MRRSIAIRHARLLPADAVQRRHLFAGAIARRNGHASDRSLHRLLPRGKGDGIPGRGMGGRRNQRRRPRSMKGYPAAQAQRRGSHHARSMAHGTSRKPLQL